MKAEEERRDAVREPHRDDAEWAGRVQRDPHQGDVVEHVAELTGRDREEEVAEVLPAQKRDRALAGRHGLLGRIGHPRSLPSLHSCRGRGACAHRRGPDDRGRLGGGGRRRGRGALGRRARQDAGRPRARRGRCARLERAHLRRQHGLRALRLDADPGGADRGAPGAAAPLARLRRRRAVPGRGRPRRDAAAGERARQGLLGRSDRDRRVAARAVEPRRAAGRAGARVGRRLGRPGAPRAPGAAADRGGRGVRGERARCRLRTRSPGSGWSRCGCRRRKGSR